MKNHAKGRWSFMRIASLEEDTDTFKLQAIQPGDALGFATMIFPSSERSERQKDNMALIEKAPEMYEALDYIVRSIESNDPESVLKTGYEMALNALNPRKKRTYCSFHRLHDCHFCKAEEIASKVDAKHRAGVE